MSQSVAQMIVCPSCGASYGWQERFAGRELNCRCGQVFVAEQPEPAAPATAQRPAPQVSAGYGAMAQAYASRSAVQRALEAREDELQPSRLKEVYLPAGVLALGMLVFMFLLLQTVGYRQFPAYLGVAWALQAVIFLPAILLSFSILARFADLDLGELRTVLFKGAALTFGPAAIADVLLLMTASLMGMNAVAVTASFGYYLVLAGVPACLMFALDAAGTAGLAAMLFITRVPIVFGLAAITTGASTPAG